MDEPFKRIDVGDNAVWITQSNEVENLLKRREIAFDVTKGKLVDSGGNVETAMQTAEAFGRGLFEDLIKNESNQWTMENLIKPVAANIFNPMGTVATFTELTDDKARSLIFSCRLHEESDDPNIASLFTYGYLRGILLSVFPNGELLMGSTIAEGAPMIEFTFKANASDDDKFERERIKNNFIYSTKKIEE